LRRCTKAEGWDQGLLQLFRSGSFGGDGERLRGAMPAGAYTLFHFRST